MNLQNKTKALVLCYFKKKFQFLCMAQIPSRQNETLHKPLLCMKREKCKVELLGAASMPCSMKMTESMDMEGEAIWTDFKQNILLNCQEDM
mgnify:CR=1 FL=1